MPSPSRCASQNHFYAVDAAEDIVAHARGFLDGRRDDRVLHAAQPAEDEKWVTQSWIRAQEDPISKLTPPRWPQGCKTYGDILKLVFE